MNIQVLNEYIKILTDFPMYVNLAFTTNKSKYKLLLDLLEERLTLYTKKRFNEASFLPIILSCQEQFLEQKVQKFVYIFQGRINRLQEIYANESISLQEKEIFIQNNQEAVQHQINTMGTDRLMIEYKEKLVNQLFQEMIEEYPIIETTMIDSIGIQVIIDLLVKQYTNVLIETVQTYLNDEYMPLYFQVEERLLDELAHQVEKEVPKPKQLVPKYRYK